MYSYDLLDRLSYVTENCVMGVPATHEVNVRSEYGYDRVGNRIVFTNALNHPTTFTYDALNRLTDETDALNHTTRYAYDGVGNRTVLTDAEAQVTTFGYDGVYRVAGIEYSNSTLYTADVTFDYDGLGNRVAQGVNSQSTNYTLDVAGGLPEVMGAGSVHRVNHALPFP